MKYAGIGSRETPADILNAMYCIGRYLALRGWELWSGGAIGADTSFERGCDGGGGKKRILRAKDCTPEWMEHASNFHGCWAACTDYVRKLHGRNSAIILGEDLSSPVDFVVCWTLAGLEGGGTGQGLRVAHAYNIPIFNLYEQDDAELKLLEWLDKRSTSSQGEEEGHGPNCQCTRTTCRGMR